MSEKTMNQSNSNEQNKPTTKLHKSLTVIGIILCVILIPVLIINCTLIIKSFLNKDDVPSIGGVMPLIVLTDSMAPEIKSGDIIICSTADAEDIKVGDVISFFDPALSNQKITTHQVIEIVKEDGKTFFRTKGTNNNAEDKMLVPAQDLVGLYTDIRIPGAGHVALFMQSTAGLIVCVVVPIVLFVGYDILRRRMYEKSKGNDMQNLMEELEALKAAKAEEEKAAAAAAPAPAADVDVAALMAELAALKAAQQAQAAPAEETPEETKQETPEETTQETSEETTEA